MCGPEIFWLAHFLKVRAGSGPFFKIPRSSTDIEYNNAIEYDIIQYINRYTLKYLCTINRIQAEVMTSLGKKIL